MNTRTIKQAASKQGLDGWLVKWGGKYDVVTPKGSFPTGLYALHQLTLEEWITLFRQHQ